MINKYVYQFIGEFQTSDINCAKCITVRIYIENNMIYYREFYYSVLKMSLVSSDLKVLSSYNSTDSDLDIINRVKIKYNRNNLLTKLL